MLGLPDAISACLFDMDGVITQTASVHDAAWKEMFDEFLRDWSKEHNVPFVPFDPVHDYDEYVDGKPRLEGTASFLQSRGIELPAGQDSDGECTLGDALPGPAVHEPSVMVISTEELQSLVGCLGTGLSPLEADALRLYLEGSSYEEMADRLGCDTKTIDNALQRVKRKIITHQRAREVAL